jgi:quinol-cytochrome oxidoreductase complex cytochrome b subunit
MSLKKNDTTRMPIESENKEYVRNFIETNITKKLIPKGMSWFGCMGGLSLVAFLIQLVTGIFLLFFFIPTARDAVSSIWRASHSIPYGWIIHRIHAVGPHIMIGMIFSHMLRIFFKRIYRHPRELHWVSGSSLLILTLLMYYTGSLLPVHNPATCDSGHLTFIYAIHIAGIPLIMGVFMGLHFFMIRKTGIYEPL